MIDVSFDFRSDTPPSKDPDAYSPTLRRYHRTLWSKELPSGHRFDLDASASGSYLRHRSALGDLVLTSDSVIPTLRRERSLADVFAQISELERESFLRLSYTIGGMMVFPGRQVGRRMTINGARGCHPRVKDRFDLTLECIRRHYAGEISPLSEVLARYAQFFVLFESFQGYVEFFLLQDLVSSDRASVRFALPFTGFEEVPIPQGLDAYIRYRENTSAFLTSRNARIHRLYGVSA